MYSAQEQLSVGIALERLALAHGLKKMDESGLMFFIEQIEKWNQPCSRVVKAIEKLYNIPLNRIDLPRIREAVLDVFTAEKAALPAGKEDRLMNEQELKAFREAVKKIKIKSITGV